MREARKIEQSHNPHYLKSTSKTKIVAAGGIDDDLDDIPIAEIALDVPLKLNGKF